ncbi:MAG: hypothetical protein AB3N13_03825 [Arenibacterium sp.]
MPGDWDQHTHLIVEKAAGSHGWVATDIIVPRTEVREEEFTLGVPPASRLDDTRFSALLRPVGLPSDASDTTRYLWSVCQGGHSPGWRDLDEVARILWETEPEHVRTRVKEPAGYFFNHWDAGPSRDFYRVVFWFTLLYKPEDT